MPITFRANNVRVEYPGGTAEWGGRGVAYEQNGFFLCMHGNDHGLRGISPGYAFTQRAVSPLEQWVTNVFGAADIRQTIFQPGQCFQRLWRPGIDGLQPVQSTLAPSAGALTQAAISLSLLLERLAALSQYVDLDERNLGVFSQQLRELLLLACIDVEVSFRAMFSLSVPETTEDSRLTTGNYFRICEPFFLREYEVKLRHFPTLPGFRPFLAWDAARPTASLPWFSAYNAIKHNREGALHRATLGACLNALAAAAILYCAQFSIPGTGDGDWVHEPSYVLNRWFAVDLIDADPATFYVPPVAIPNDRTDRLWMFDGRNTANWEPEIRAI